MYTTIFLFLLLLNCCDSLYRQSNIVFQSNGYSNVLLAIHDSVTDETILDKIKDAFTKASTTLHTATKKRAYFKEIVILVPNSWKDSPGITPAAAGQTLQYADIIVSAPLPTHRNFPYTRSYAACGHSGIHIQMLTDVFIHPSKPPVKLSPEKFIVHEWGTFRWGVFNEYPNPGENEFYYSTMFGRADPIRCSMGLLGRSMARFPNGTMSVSACNFVKGPLDPITGLVDQRCKYYPYPYHNRGFESMMDHQWIKEITHFCDDQTDYKHNKYGHNSEAPNMHNRLCGHRSTMTVIEGIEDFRNGLNQPQSISNLVPTFKIVKAARTKRATLYLDDDTLRSNQIADHVISMLPPNTRVLLRHPNQHTGHHLRRRAVKHGDKKIILSKGVNHNTLSALTTKALNTESSTDHLIVITCNNTAMNNNHLRKSNIYFVENGCPERSNKPYTSLHELTHFIHDYEQGPVYLYHQDLSLTKDSIFHGSFIVDEDLNGILSIRVSYDTNPGPQLKLKDPNGKRRNDIDVDDKLKVLHFTVDSPEKGKWTITVSTAHSTGQHVDISVAAHTHITNHQQPITVSAKAVQQPYQDVHRIAVFAEVRQGHHSVIGLKVTAISQLDEREYKTDLYDNGSGADIQTGDGIFSRFLPYHQNVHGLKIQVSDSFGNGHILNTSLVFNEDEIDSEERYESTKTPLKHGISRVTMISPDISIPDTNTNRTMIPPARIHDLKSYGMNNNNIITITFTATGDDLDHGRANHYEILYAHTSQEIFSSRQSLDSIKRVPQSSVMIGSLYLPRSSGQQEVFRINATRLAPNQNSFTFVIVPVDGEGNKGDMSNLVTAGSRIH